MVTYISTYKVLFLLCYRKKFGVYDVVSPTKTTPSREVPKHIIRPGYVSLSEKTIPREPEIKDVVQISGMKKSCKLAASILEKLEGFIQVF